MDEDKSSDIEQRLADAESREGTAWHERQEARERSDAAVDRYEEYRDLHDEIVPGNYDLNGVFTPDDWEIERQYRDRLAELQLEAGRTVQEFNQADREWNDAWRDLDDLISEWQDDLSYARLDGRPVVGGDPEFKAAALEFGGTPYALGYASANHADESFISARRDDFLNAWADLRRAAENAEDRLPPLPTPPAPDRGRNIYEQLAAALALIALIALIVVLLRPDTKEQPLQARTATADANVTYCLQRPTPVSCVIPEIPPPVLVAPEITPPPIPSPAEASLGAQSLAPPVAIVRPEGAVPVDGTLPATPPNLGIDVVEPPTEHVAPPALERPGIAAETPAIEAVTPQYDQTPQYEAQVPAPTIVDREVYVPEYTLPSYQIPDVAPYPAPIEVPASSATVPTFDLPGELTLPPLGGDVKGY